MCWLLCVVILASLKNRVPTYSNLSNLQDLGQQDVAVLACMPKGLDGTRSRKNISPETNSKTAPLLLGWVQAGLRRGHVMVVAGKHFANLCLLWFSG